MRILFFSLFLLISCAEKCPKENDLGEYYLSEQSKQIFPYQNGENKLIFKDSLQNVLTFEIISNEGVHLSEINWKEECRANDSIKKQIDVTAKREWQTIILKPDSLINLSFNIFLKQEVDVDASDLDAITEIDGINIFRGNVSQMGIVTDLKNTTLDELPTEEVKSITINGKKYTNLLKSRYMNSGDIYYDVEKGIVAINEHLGRFEKAKYWTLDSVAYGKPKTHLEDAEDTGKSKYDNLRKSHQLYGRWEIHSPNQEVFSYEIYQKENEFIGVFTLSKEYYDFEILVRKGNKFYEKGIEEYGEYYIIDSNKQMTLFDESGKMKGYTAKLISSSH